MNPNQSLSNIRNWQTRLGLMPIPLFKDDQTDPSYVLLNGNSGNFCLDLNKPKDETDYRDFAWSANVGHYINIFDDFIQIYKWDQHKSKIERYSQSSVSNNLEKFHEYLEKDLPRQEISIISHTIGIFRKLRAILGAEVNGPESLNVFLYFLGSVADQVEKGTLVTENWKLPEQTKEIVGIIRDGDWEELVNQFSSGRSVEQLKPNISLMLRHAAGQLFQEANYEAQFLPQFQYNLDGILPSPAKLSRQPSGIGVHFTPPALSRTIVEEALDHFDFSTKSITIFDPACGSGEFLREALRQLSIKKYNGTIKVIGWDISKSACDMARYVLAWEKRVNNYSAEIDINEIDSVEKINNWPNNIDMILMNPPFVAWQDLQKNKQVILKEILGDFGAHSPNLAYAFLMKSVDCIRKNGVLGTILPASVLSATSAIKLREYISNQMAPKLIARLGSHSIFFNATVDPSLYVASKTTDSNKPVKAFWADFRSNSNSSGLRTLRKIRLLGESNNLPISEDGFSIYLDNTLGRNEQDWSPRNYSSWLILNQLKHFPRVNDLFEIHQGVRTGLNEVFVLELDEWDSIPSQERKYFRPAVINKSIKFGFLKASGFVFFPYDSQSFNNEDMVQKKIPYYYSNYLLPNKKNLLSRDKINTEKWWELSRNATRQVQIEPKIVSTYFGSAGSFAWDDSGKYVVVQGFSWIPKYSGINLEFQKNYSLAYLAILNSNFFAQLLSSVSNNLSGGQWDLSKRFLDKLPMPDLQSAAYSTDFIEQLTSLGNKIFMGLSVDEKIQDKTVKSAYFLE